MGMFDDLVQAEVNAVHNSFAQERDELPTEQALLTERRAARTRPGAFSPAKHGVLGPMKPMDPKKKASIDKSIAKMKKRMAVLAREIESAAKAIGHTVLSRGVTIATKDLVQDQLHHIKHIIDKLDTSVRMVPTEPSSSRYGEGVEHIHDLLAELKECSPEETHGSIDEMMSEAQTVLTNLEEMGLVERKNESEKPAYASGYVPKERGHVDEALGDVVNQLTEVTGKKPKSGLSIAEKRVRHAMALMKEAGSTSNEGVTYANQENAIRALLAAAEDMAHATGMKKTAGNIHSAWKSVDAEARS